MIIKIVISCVNLLLLFKIGSLVNEFGIPWITNVIVNLVVFKNFVTQVSMITIITKL